MTNGTHIFTIFICIDMMSHNFENNHDYKNIISFFLCVFFFGDGHVKLG